MVQIWYMDYIVEDPRLPHHYFPPRLMSTRKLLKLTNNRYFKIRLNGSIDKENQTRRAYRIEKIKNFKGYDHCEQIWTISQNLQIWAEKNVDLFRTEKVFNHEVARLVLDGGLYIDLQDCNGNWIRVHLEAGDMLITPSGVPHRISLDSGCFVKAVVYSCSSDREFSDDMKKHISSDVENVMINVKIVRERFA